MALQLEIVCLEKYSVFKFSWIVAKFHKTIYFSFVRKFNEKKRKEKKSKENADGRRITVNEFLLRHQFIQASIEV